MSHVSSYRDLKVWHRAMELAVACYQLTTALPDSERFGLNSQIRRAASSVPANIAEGHGRQSTGSFLNHISIALGSLMELETHLTLCERLNLLDSSQVDAVLSDTSEIGRMLNGLARFLRSKSDS